MAPCLPCGPGPGLSVSASLPWVALDEILGQVDKHLCVGSVCSAYPGSAHGEADRPTWLFPHSSWG